MKTGLTIQQMAQELLRQSKAKQDYLVNTGSLSLSVTSDAPQLRVTENGLDIQGTGGRKMYVLEFRTTNRHHTWLRCAICETKAPLERVRRGQPNMTRWRILRLPGTVQAACAKWRSVPLMRYGQKSA